jgi:putative transposase
MIKFLSLIFRLNIITWLLVENMALRQQLAIFKKQKPRPRLRKRDRIFWVLLSNFWKDWRICLKVVRPETVIRWHRHGFKIFWSYKSKSKKSGRPKIDPEMKSLIIKIAKENPLWGAPRIHGELLKLGFKVSERTVSNLIPDRNSKGTGQSWKIFLRNHLSKVCSIDFFTIHTFNFKILYVLVILSHDRRRVVHFNITQHPTAFWTLQQIKEAFPWDSTPKYLLRDRDSIYGKVFRQGVKSMNIKEIITTYKSPWQNGYVERMIGSIRRDCLDHHIILGENHLRQVLKEYLEYYHQDRTHYGLNKDTPRARPVETKPDSGKVVSLPRCGGLHHRYEWKKAA